MKEKILLIEDEVKISRFVELELKYEGYEVDVAFDGRKGLEMAKETDASLIILDIMLPKMNGIEVLRRLREVSDIPVILLTARDQTMDKVMGLDMGAEDYMTKPFEIEELLARIRVILKRKIKVGSIEHSTLSIGKLVLDEMTYEAKYDEELINLTKKEFDLLKCLIQNKNVVLNRDQILENVWGYSYYGDTNVVDVYIRYLRSKIDDHYNVKIIRTVRGVGYTIKDE
ncbi:MAG: response regulator transcription factor [Clostridia bacterium]|nr:response regulator transcription factor [Clostridia bacterium]